MKSKNQSPQSKTHKSTNNSLVKETNISPRVQHSKVICYYKRIESFSEVIIQNDCSFIDLSINYLKDFKNFPLSLSELTTLILDDNQIKSFQGIQQQNSFPKLRFISLRKNPISTNIHLKIMCIIVFGNQLYSINGEKVNDKQRQAASKLCKLLFNELVQGKVVKSLNPIKLKDTSLIENSNSNQNSPDSQIKPKKDVHLSNSMNYIRGKNLQIHVVSEERNYNTIQKMTPVHRIHRKKEKQRKIDEDQKNINEKQITASIHHCEKKEAKNDDESPKITSNNQIIRKEETKRSADEEPMLISNQQNLTDKEAKRNADEKTNLNDENEEKSKNNYSLNAIHINANEIDQKSSEKNKAERKTASDTKSFPKIKANNDKNSFKEELETIKNTQNEKEIENSKNNEISNIVPFDEHNEKEKNQYGNNTTDMKATFKPQHNEKLFDFSSAKFIDDLLVDNDVEMAPEFPESCQHLILDD